ncbi:MAG: exosortase/archaeosortase family protein [Verrucomicrobiota bacterium JB025]|nr:exosortase/archaeosortase family protein [Verrucomicrobiota bacterium JB025]
MPENPTEPAIDGDLTDGGDTAKYGRWGAVLLTVLVLVWFYGFESRYGSNRSQSAFEWILSAWNGENDYEHGPLFPLVIAGLIVHRFKSLKASVSKGVPLGLLVVLLGALCYAAGYRTLQPRVAMGALPFLLWGGAWYLWGTRVAKQLFFPLFFFWLAIPLPSFQQATTHLQLLATSMAHHGAGLFGVDTVVQGNMIASATGGWEPLEIAKGCSGIRSLMALLMISGAWAYVANLSMWKRVVLFLAAFPLAIIGNTLRVVSIFVIAEYGNAEWARGSWHDWSGLLLFYPFSLMLLLLIHSLLEGGLPWKKEKRRELRRVVVSSSGNSEKPEPLGTES